MTEHTPLIPNKQDDVEIEPCNFHVAETLKWVRAATGTLQEAAMAAKRDFFFFKGLGTSSC